MKNFIEKYRKLFIIIVLVFIFMFMSLILLYHNYISPVNNNNSLKEIVVEKGMTSSKIGELLEEEKLIKDSKFFLIYLKLNNINNLKAGHYKLSSSMGLKEIVSSLQDGSNYNPDEITITFKEGINFREIARVIESNTNNSYDDVINSLNDKDYLNTLIEDYWFITDEILDSNIYYPLEGYLYPETYNFKNKDVTIHEIFKKLLDQMGNMLEPYKEKIEVSGFSVHEILTLASIAEKEVIGVKEDNSDRKNVISVFLNRINNNISLGSDVTTRYAIKLDESRPLTKSEYNSTSLYNTRNINNLGLMPGPIAMVSKSSIDASINPNQTNYIYFISNINTNETFFFERSQDFEAKKKELQSVNGGY